ncbi:hypothetical protein HDU91_002368, partial [Kappamyces sp. JEL0680]
MAESPPKPLVLDGSLPRLVAAFQKSLDDKLALMDFVFQDMSLQLPNGSKILQGVSGSIKSKRMTAIMVGADLSYGRVSRTSGTLAISGKPAEISQFKKLIGYVPQDDVMIRELREVEEYVDCLLDVLNLTGVRDSIIGDETKRGVSGGQRKRVNIGIELAACPVCIFLDEPTSGLDSTAALEVAQTLRKITRLGLTTPRLEIFEIFDDLLLIIPGGRTAYLGPVAQVQSYFESLGFHFDARGNPADVLMDILSGKGSSNCAMTPSDIADAWLQQTVASRLITTRGASVLKQFVLSHNRSIVQQLSAPGSVALELSVGAAAGIVMGVSLRSQDSIYTGAYLAPFTAMTPTALEW